ncbi:MAG TPA: radical SAM protein [Pseudobdellovibrionaceae bacterium]|nr:radical SAM protein [Pseudobdellovibrionaceae bacterium]
MASDSSVPGNQRIPIEVVGAQAAGGVSVTGHHVGFDKVMCRFKWDYPIINLVSGHARNCCRTPKQKITSDDLERYGKDAIMNRPYELERRREKFLGITHVDCESCVRLEANGVKAPRSGADAWVREYWLRWGYGTSPFETAEVLFPQIAQTLEQDDRRLYSYRPQMLEIVLGNTCNQKCTYCSLHYSTQWAQELLQFGDVTPEKLAEEFPEAPEKLEAVFWEWFYDLARYYVDTINLLGGEPTYNPKFWPVIEKLLHAYEDMEKMPPWPVELGLITNLNLSSESLRRLMNLMPRLTGRLRFRLQPSIEATGQRAEYIRHGLKWPLFEANVREVCRSTREMGLSPENFQIGFQTALNALSISDLPQFLNWVQGLNDEYGLRIGLMKNLVSFPRHHNPMILTPDFARYLEPAIDLVARHEEENDRITKHQNHFGSWYSYRVDLLQPLYERLRSPERTDFDLNSRQAFLQFIEQNNQRRQVDFLRDFPEYAEFWRVCEASHGQPAERGGLI